MRPPPLPATYLRYFSIDPSRCARDSWVWRITPSGAEQVQVSAECPSVGRFSGSKTEELYARIVDKVRLGLDLNVLERHDLIAAMFEFHVRGLAQPADSGHNADSNDRRRRHALLASVLLNQPAGSVRTAALVAHLQERWGLCIFNAADGHCFITSDSPAVRLCLNPQYPALHMVLLPMTPRHLAVAYDKQFVEPAHTVLDAADHPTLNAAQVGASSTTLYSHRLLGRDELAALERQRANRCRVPCQIEHGEWLVPPHCLPPINHYSFLRLVSPPWEPAGAPPASPRMS